MRSCANVLLGAQVPFLPSSFCHLCHQRWLLLTLHVSSETSNPAAIHLRPTAVPPPVMHDLHDFDVPDVDMVYEHADGSFSTLQNSLDAM